MGSDSPPQSGRRERIRAARVSHYNYPSVPGSVFFSAGAIQGSGTILDISTTGAHVYQPSKNVPRGVVLDMFFLQTNTKRKLHAEGEVVRKTETGFAVRFLRIERELVSLVLAAAVEAEREP